MSIKNHLGALRGRRDFRPEEVKINCLFLIMQSDSYQILYAGSKNIVICSRSYRILKLENTGHFSTSANINHDFPKMGIFGISIKLYSIYFAIIPKLDIFFVSVNLEHMSRLEFQIRPIVFKILEFQKYWYENYGVRNMACKT